MATGDEPTEAAEQPTLQEQLRLFQRLAVPYFEQAEGAKLQFGLLLLLVLLDAGVSVVFSFVGRDFYSALSAKDRALFIEKTANFAVGLAVATPLTVLFRFQRSRLALNWRAWMTTELARQYYTDKTYYQIEMDPRVDNPDQRITEDVKAFTQVSLDFFIDLMTSVIDLVSFSGILYSIYPELFYAIFAYATFGSLTTIQLGKTLVGQNAQVLLREANLRYSLVRLRENAESIAFYGGEAQEAREVCDRLEVAVEGRRAVLGTQRNLEFFTTAYAYLIQILPVLVVSPLYFAGTIELGVITQSSGAFNSILDDLSLIVNEYEGLSRFSAGLRRLTTFVERMERYQRNATNATFVLSDAQRAKLVVAAEDGPPDFWKVPAPFGKNDGTARAAPTTLPVPALSSPPPLPESEGIRNVELEMLPGGSALAIDELSLRTPDGARLLFANVSLTVRCGEHLLVTGQSGAGKSSMLRAIAGLWTRGSGSVTRPLTAETMFLPQRPYCTLGSLRQQLIYPQPLEEWSREGLGTDDALLRALGEVQLTRLASEGSAGLDAVRDWADELSLGEQQRLSIARVLISKPSLAILDEATSALDLENESLLYRALGRVAGLTYLSVGHRPSLLNFHASRLRLYGVERTPSYAIESIDRT